jgi:hypothetical protein
VASPAGNQDERDNEDEQTAEHGGLSIAAPDRNVA